MRSDMADVQAQNIENNCPANSGTAHSSAKLLAIKTSDDHKTMRILTPVLIFIIAGLFVGCTSSVHTQERDAVNLVVDAEALSRMLDNPNVVVLHVARDRAHYDEGHVPGAIGWDWHTQLCDTVRRDVIGKEQIEALLAGSGISRLVKGGRSAATKVLVAMLCPVDVTAVTDTA